MMGLLVPCARVCVRVARRLPFGSRSAAWTAELASASTAVLWAGLARMTPAGLEALPTGSALLRIAPHGAWQAAAAGLGAWQMLALAGGWRRARWLTALTMGWFWALLALAVWSAAPWAPGAAVYAGWCGANVLRVLRLWRPGG